MGWVGGGGGVWRPMDLSVFLTLRMVGGNERACTHARARTHTRAHTHEYVTAAPATLMTPLCAKGSGGVKPLALAGICRSLCAGTERDRGNYSQDVSKTLQNNILHHPG